MKYLVMECHPGYAVVLDEKGRFQKAANLGYQVGQSVEKVVLMREPKSTVPIRQITAGFAAIAACILVMFTALFQNMETVYASVYMQINPEVRMDVDRENRVIQVEGVNEDGRDLVENYTGYKKKSLETVTDELVDRAAEMGYLSPGGTVHISLDSQDNDWAVQISDQLNQHLRQTFTDIVVEVEIQPPASEVSYNSSVVSSEPDTIEIPVTPPASKPESSFPTVSSIPSTSYSDSDYGQWSEPEDDMEDKKDTDLDENDSEYNAPEVSSKPSSPYEPAEESYSDSSYDLPKPSSPEEQSTDYGTPYSSSEKSDSPYDPEDNQPDDNDNNEDDNDEDDNDDEDNDDD